MTEIIRHDDRLVGQHNNSTMHRVTITVIRSSDRYAFRPFRVELVDSLDTTPIVANFSSHETAMHMVEVLFKEHVLAEREAPIND